jgi:hypothetical protein
VKTPGEIFTFMQTNKIGERVSLFWIAWGFVAEKAENFKLADQIFQKGIRRLAEPKELLQQRYRQFQRRMARHFLNQSEIVDTNSNNSSVQGISESSRQVLGKLTKSQLSSGHRASAADISHNSSSSSREKIPSFKQVNSTSNQFNFIILQDEPILSNNNTVITGVIEEEAALEQPISSGWKSVPLESTTRKENEGMCYILEY